MVFCLAAEKEKILLYNILEVCYDIHDENEIIIIMVRSKIMGLQFIIFFILYKYVLRKYTYK